MLSCRTIASLLLALVVWAIPLSAQAIQTPYVDTDKFAGTSRQPEWMRWIPNNTSLAALSLPGTHDTMTYNKGDSSLNWVVTQSKSLDVQLNAGIRVLDIRARHYYNGFPIHHDSVYLGFGFEQVLDVTVDFLRKHPTETVLMRLKEEYTPEGNTRTFAETFRYYRDLPAYADSIWRGSSIPTLGEVRGKIVILADFSAGQDDGIRWGMLDLQDAWDETNVDIKWDLVRKQLDAASAGDPGKMYVNFLSASGVTSNCEFPFAGTPSCIARDVNESAFEYLYHGNTHRTGVVMMDFPGPGLIELLIARNPQGNIHSLPTEGGSYRSGTTLELGVDRQGQDYASFLLREARPELCREACFSDYPRCQAFTFIRADVGVSLQAGCFLKSGLGTPVLNPLAVSGTALADPDIGLYSGLVETNVDRPGQDYKVIQLQEARPELCRAACLDEPLSCKAFTYVRPSTEAPVPLCYLKSGVPAPVPNARCDSGLVSGSGQKTGQTALEVGVDRPGEDYRWMELEEARPELCRNACFDDAPRCQAFTYVRPGRSTVKAMCYLKKGLAWPKLDPDTVSGTVVTGTRDSGLYSGLVETNINRPGSDYRSFDLPAPLPELCRDACRAESNLCKAFTYVKPDPAHPGGTCYLKFAVPAPVPDAWCDSGVNDGP